MNVKARHLHVPLHPMAHNGPLAGRLAERHYASFANETAQHSTDVATWLTRIMALLEASGETTQAIWSNAVECTLWIAILACDAPPAVEIDPTLIATAQRLGAKVLVENYNRSGAEGNPEKIWFC